MRKTFAIALCAGGLGLLSCAVSVGAEQSAAGTARSNVARHACAALVARAEADESATALLLRSYDAAGANDPPGEPALRTVAFTYDNALAVVALLACGHPASAARIGEALRRAAVGDARLRNAYRAGAASGKPLSNGWWDARANRWDEDAYQMGSATGNVAWAALALLALDESTGKARWREAAEGLAHWVVAEATDRRGSGGFSGGVYGFDPAPRRLTWKSTEHNTDLVAVFAWLARLEPGGGWQAQESRARRFVESQWDEAGGRFRIGTQPDGVTENSAKSALDVQLWTLLVPGAPKRWHRSIGYAEEALRVPGGFDFNGDRDGLWLEGTAQAALVYRRLGRTHDADALFTTLAGQFAQSGYVYATREPRITTGLSVDTSSDKEDFFYYRLPHLGATAWAALAALDWNPFMPGGR